MSLRKKLVDTFGAQVSSDHERYPADVKCLNFLYLYVGRYPRNNASRNTQLWLNPSNGLIKANLYPHKGYPNLGAAVLVITGNPTG